VLPLITPLKIFAGVIEEILYGSEPPEIVMFELCPAKIEIEFWLNANAPPVLALLTFAVNVPQLPAYAQMLMVDVPVLEFAIKVKILLFTFACTMLGLEFEET
jgi:hypothetical protein